MTARRRLLALAGVALASAALACADMVSPAPPKADDPGALFDEVWTQYDRHYAFFASRRVNWDSVRTSLRPSALAGGPALYNALCRMLEKLNDYHVVLFSDYGACGSPRMLRTYPYDPTIAANYLGSSYRVSASRLTTWGTVALAGYIRIARFAGDAQPAEIDAALAGIPYMQGLIVDMRGNLGGNSKTAEAIAGRFADATRPYLTLRVRSGPGHDEFTAPQTWSVRPAGAKRWTGRVVLIVDRSVGSAGEDFTMAMRVLPNVIVLGDTTSGNASNPLWRELPNGWSYWVPQSMETTIDGITPTVDGGIPPAVFVRPTAADSAAGRDAMIDAAVALISQQQ